MRRLLLFCLLAAGCATVGGGGAQVRRLQDELKVSEQARAELARRVDDLENRVILLTERVERMRGEGARVEAPRGLPARDARDPAEGIGRLPVVTLRPAAPEPEGPAEGALDGTSEPVAPDDRPPIKIRMTGTPQRAGAAGVPAKAAAVSSSPVAAGPVAAGALPNLGVVKLPDRGVPVAHAGGGAGDDEAGAAAIYQKGHAALRAGRYEEAEAAFRDFVRRWPRHENADNAQYWLAESHYARKDYRAAVVEFRYVVERWPDGNKAPDAQLKHAFSQLALGDEAGGRKALAQVVARYPGTDAARLAERRLSELAPTEKNR